MNYVLDSFAVIAYLQDEKGSGKVATILERARGGKAKVHMHTINLGEVFYTVWREEGESAANSIYGIVKMYPVEFSEDLSEDLLLSAARLKAAYAISYADAFAAALALKKNATLITGDPDFKQLETDKRIEVLWLE